MCSKFLTDADFSCNPASMLRHDEMTLCVITSNLTILRSTDGT